MNEIYESYSIDTDTSYEIIDEMDSNELENLMNGLSYLIDKIQSQEKVVIDSDDRFRQVFNIITGKRKKIKKQIELDKHDAFNCVSEIYEALDKRYRLVAKKETENKIISLHLTNVAIQISEFANKNSIPLSQEFETSLSILTGTSIEHSNSGYLTTSKETRADHMLGSREGSNTSHEGKKESDNLVEDPKLKRKLRALRKDGYTDEDIEKEFGKLYIGLRTTDSYTTRRLKFHPPKYEPKGLIGNKARYNKELKLFDSRKKKIEKILNSKYRENYIIDKEWIYFIDEISCCLCRIRLDASEPEEKVFKDVNVLGSIYIKYGMICFTDSKYNEVKIRVPN